MKAIEIIIKEMSVKSIGKLHNEIVNQQKQVDDCEKCIANMLLLGQTDTFSLRQKFTFLATCKNTAFQMELFFESLFGITVEDYEASLEEEIKKK